mmetsp:Transcript_97024/g.244642  ORF Transcript_97024/g.244642 Transcript_97024/m.244642 type:complete len:225 (-) Transcript_97024:629-1303(-)
MGPSDCKRGKPTHSDPASDNYLLPSSNCNHNFHRSSKCMGFHPRRRGQSTTPTRRSESKCPACFALTSSRSTHWCQSSKCSLDNMEFSRKTPCTSMRYSSCRLCSCSPHGCPCSVGGHRMSCRRNRPDSLVSDYRHHRRPCPHSRHWHQSTNPTRSPDSNGPAFSPLHSSTSTGCCRSSKCSPDNAESSRTTACTLLHRAASRRCSCSPHRCPPSTPGRRMSCR